MSGARSILGWWGLLLVYGCLIAAVGWGVESLVDPKWWANHPSVEWLCVRVLAFSTISWGILAIGVIAGTLAPLGTRIRPKLPQLIAPRHEAAATAVGLIAVLIGIVALVQCSSR